MSKRSTKSPRRGVKRGKRAPVVLERQDELGIAEFFRSHGLALMPLAQLLCECKLKLNDLLAGAGQALIEWLLQLSAESVAGPKSQGRAVERELVWYGQQAGRVGLLERNVKVMKPRLRTKGPGAREVAIPAYEALRCDPQAPARMSEILLSGVSTRHYAGVLPKMAKTVGVSRSQLSRKLIQAGAKLLQGLMSRSLEALQILVVYIDGVVVAGQSVVVAIGVDTQGAKHLLGLTLGATENATVVKDLLADLLKRGLAADRKRLFVIDGSKALRAAIERTFGEAGLVQRCRVHKLRNVLDYLPEGLKAQVKASINAAFKLAPKEGMARLKQQAAWLKREHPQAAASLLEGLEELFTVNRLGLTPGLMRCLSSTNVIENPNGRFRALSRNVTHWQDGEMILRWAAVCYLEAEKGWRKVHGHHDIWILRQALGWSTQDKGISAQTTVDASAKAA
jgi:transposase-like protein